jgi:hypothetical protein
MRLRWRGGVLVALVAGALTASFTVPAAVASPPTASPIDVKYVVAGASKGSGTALAYEGGVYVPLGAIKVLTGEQANWDAATSTVSISGPSSVNVLTYMDDLPGQPYYSVSRAICWQTGKDGRVASMNGPGTCNVALPASPSLDGQHFSHELEFIVSATGAKTVQATNSITEKYSLYGRYSHLSVTVGLLDNLNPERMAVEFYNYGKLLHAVTLSPGTGPVHFSVNVAHVQVLTLVVANVSGAAPGWDNGAHGGFDQYVPGAVMLADPSLSPAAGG